MSNIKPLSDYVLIEPLQQETTTASGIVIPDTVKEKPQEGKVIAAGPGRTDDGVKVELQVKVGDIVGVIVAVTVRVLSSVCVAVTD